ncbi:MAG: TIGR04283 family arsenosugar biosynthesis glycosyltransferase [Alphaproteobacteria bacterium]|nr:TIGR04283 family arsenosugar biosynthesis glycosyltransferase [Alphaproteobacteria bacterium]
MISVVIPTLNAESTLGPCLAALVPAALDGVVRQVIIADGGSTDQTIAIADDAGADLVVTGPGRGQQIIAGLAEARSPWLLILHADTILESGWEAEASGFMESVDTGSRSIGAAAFRFKLVDAGFMPRLVDKFVHFRSTLAGLPYGDQGLLIPRRLHEEIGGYSPLPLMEDIDIVRRLGRKRLTILTSCANTSARRFLREGYIKRIVRNQICLAMYATGTNVERIATYYRAQSAHSQGGESVSPVAENPPTPTIKPS